MPAPNLAQPRACRGRLPPPGADSDITSMTQVAAQKVHTDITPGWPGLRDPQLDLEFRIRIAEAALGLFIDQMIAAWPDFNQPGAAAIVGEKTFEKAKKKLCPLWPIC